MYQLAVLILFFFSTSAFASNDVEIIIKRSEHRLIVKKNHDVLNTFRVALGSGGRKAKLRRGDHTTPKGTYYIKRIRDSDHYHVFLQLDYPSVKDAIRALKSKIITKAEYNAILDAHIAGKMPPQDTKLGGSIGIHGLGSETQDRIEIHQIADWTQGCIAVRNNEIDILKHYVKNGTKVRIEY